MCPVCMATATAMIVSGLTTVGGLSTAAVKPRIRLRAKKPAQPTENASGRKWFGKMRELKRQETGK